MRAYYDAAMVLTEVPGLVDLSAGWRGACVILSGAFPHDRRVWAHVIPGVCIELDSEVRDTRRPLADRLLLAAAQSLVDGKTTLPLGGLVNLSDRRLRLVLDGLAIARGGLGLPID